MLKESIKKIKPSVLFLLFLFLGFNIPGAQEQATHIFSLSGACLGQKIFFGSNRPPKTGGEPLKALDIYVAERTANNTWSRPRNIGLPVNTDYGENYPSVASNGNLYFFSCRNQGLGGCEIYVSRFYRNKYFPAENHSAQG